MTRHMFAGATTPNGFVNYFNCIMPLDNAKKRYFLKGSSGSGKSTFIKKIAAAFESAGYGMDLFHCSNDAGSLDGVSVKEKGICVIDGTAPHVCDPELPAVIDKIIDFAVFIDESKVSGYTDEIQSLLRRKKLLTEKGRGFLAAAGKVYTAERIPSEAALKRASIQEMNREWFKVFDSVGKPGCSGMDRKMFLKAVTPDGVVSFANEALSGCIVYSLYDEAGTAAYVFLSKLRDEANARGINTESFSNPFEPNALECLLLPEMKTAFAVTGGYHGYSGRADEIIDFSSCYDSETLGYTKSGMDINGGLFGKLLNESIDLMKASRTLHARIEEIYINAIDFKKINELTDRIISELLY